MPLGNSGSAAFRSTIESSFCITPMCGPVEEAKEISRMGRGQESGEHEESVRDRRVRTPGRR